MGKGSQCSRFLTELSRLSNRAQEDSRELGRDAFGHELKGISYSLRSRGGWKSCDALGGVGWVSIVVLHNEWTWKSCSVGVKDVQFARVRVTFSKYL